VDRVQALQDFLEDFSFDPADPVFICVGVGHTMRGNQPVGGQVWKQGNREITATSKPLEEMDNGNESVALSGIVEALSWRHVLKMTSDPGHQRRGQRIIVYPKLLTKFETVLTTANVGFDMDGGPDIAYDHIYIHTYIYLVWPQLGTWLHRTTARSAGSRGTAWSPSTFLSDCCHAVPLNLLTRL
jgi:hypothetical protein